MLKISLILGAVAALADVAGGLVLVRARGVERYLRYFVALGAGFLMATALLEMTPESLRMSPRLGPVLIMAGYCVMHLLEHTINAHFHYGEETHARRICLAAHGLFGAGRPERSCALRRRSHRFGLCGFQLAGLADFSGHPAAQGAGGVHHGQRDDGQRAKPEGGILVRSGAGRATLAGVLVIQLVPRWVPFGLPVSAGVALYVAATDLVPEVNREPGIRMALVFFAGVAAFLLLRMRAGAVILCDFFV